MKIFTPKGIEKIRELCKNADLTATWQEEDGHLYAFTRGQRADLIKEGLPAFEKIEQSYKELTGPVPGGHHQYLETLVFNFLRDEVLISLDEEDFSKECYMFWNLLDEMGKANLGEVVSEMIFDIRVFIKEHSFLHIDLNLEVLLTRENEFIYVTPDMLSWDAMQLNRAKMDIPRWLYLLHDELASENEDLRKVNASLVGRPTYSEYSRESIMHIAIAKNFKEYLEKYPEGIDAQKDNCLKISYEGKMYPDYVALHPFEPTTEFQARATIGAFFISESLYEVEDISVVPRDDTIHTLPSLGEPFEDALKREISKYSKMVCDPYNGSYKDSYGRRLFQKKQRPFSFSGSYKDSYGRRLFHYAYIANDLDTIKKLKKLDGDRKDIDDWKYWKDQFGYTPYGLLQALWPTSMMDRKSKHVSLFFGELLLQKHLEELPKKNETALTWETQCFLEGEGNDTKFYVIELKELEDYILDTTVLALRVDIVDGNEETDFEILPLKEINNIKPVEMPAMIFLDGTYNDCIF